jgi:hypothetical protein
VAGHATRGPQRIDRGAQILTPPSSPFSLRITLQYVAHLGGSVGLVLDLLLPKVAAPKAVALQRLSWRGWGALRRERRTASTPRSGTVERPACWPCPLSPKPFPLSLLLSLLVALPYSAFPHSSYPYCCPYPSPYRTCWPYSLSLSDGTRPPWKPLPPPPPPPYCCPYPCPYCTLPRLPLEPFPIRYTWMSSSITSSIVMIPATAALSAGAAPADDDGALSFLVGDGWFFTREENIVQC